MKYFSNDDILWFLKKNIQAEGSARRWAKVNGFSEQYLSDLIHGRRDITDRVLDVLGLERVTIKKRVP